MSTKRPGPWVLGSGCGCGEGEGYCRREVDDGIQFDSLFGFRSLPASWLVRACCLAALLPEFEGIPSCLPRRPQHRPHSS